MVEEKFLESSNSTRPLEGFSAPSFLEQVEIIDHLKIIISFIHSDSHQFPRLFVVKVRPFSHESPSYFSVFPREKMDASQGSVYGMNLPLVAHRPLTSGM